MKSRLALVAACILSACGTLESSDALESTGAEVATSASTEVIPTTVAPTTVAPTTQQSTTVLPTTELPTTRPPTTQPPTSEPPGPTSPLNTRDEHNFLRSTGRLVAETGYSPFAIAGDVLLYLPAAEVEYIGFHESGHDGSQQQIVTSDLEAIGLPWTTMETRDRGTGDRSNESRG